MLKCCKLSMKAQYPCRSLLRRLLRVLKRVEEVAGPRPQASGLQSVGKQFLEAELDRVEKIKAGRSADIIVEHRRSG